MAFSLPVLLTPIATGWAPKENTGVVPSFSLQGYLKISNHLEKINSEL